MKQQVIAAGQGDSYEWSQDHILVKAPQQSTGGRLTLVEDTLKPGFHLARHHHRVMVEIFYILAGEVEFRFDDETVLAAAGMTIIIPPHIWHEVTSVNGGELLTIFSPGGFDQYLEEMQNFSEEQFADESLMTALAEKYDTWLR